MLEYWIIQAAKQIKSTNYCLVYYSFETGFRQFLCHRSSNPVNNFSFYHSNFDAVTTICRHCVYWEQISKYLLILLVKKPEPKMANYNLNELARVLATKAMEDEDIDIDSMLTRIAGPSAAWIPSSFSAEDHRITATDASINRGATPSRVLSRPGEASSTSLSDPGFRSPINDLPDVLSSIPMPHNREPLTPVAVPANIQATPDDRTPKTPTSPRPMTSTSSQTHSVFIPTHQSPKNKSRKPSEKMKNIFKSKGFKIGTFIAAGTLGAVGAIAAAPLVVAGLGFTSAGIAAGSAAASIMSTLGGGATAAGSTVAILQSIGATGTVLGSAVATGAAATAGGIVGVAAGAGVNAGISAAIQNTNSGGKSCRSIGTQTDDDEEKVEENEAP